MTKRTKDEAAQHAADLMADGYHCSEAIFIAVGKHELGKVTDEMIRMTTPFAGGIGSQHKDLCGALTGGIMAIGAIDGRSDSRVNDDNCLALTSEYRDAFLEKFGSLVCEDLKQGACGEITRQASLLLMNLLEEAG